MKNQKHIISYVEADDRMRPKAGAAVHTENVTGNLNEWMKSKKGNWRVLWIVRKPCRKK